jgi:hypothetical protein
MEAAVKDRATNAAVIGWFAAILVLPYTPVISPYGLNAIELMTRWAVFTIVLVLSIGAYAWRSRRGIDQ